ncbi:MAG: hypothetical protein AAF597_09140 [Bacteroidota bacterium]
MAPYRHQQRTNGDAILVEEWNNIGLKIETINEKFNEESAQIHGPLTIFEQLTTEELQVTLDGEVKGSLNLSSHLEVSGGATLAGRLQVNGEGRLGGVGSPMKMGYVGPTNHAGIAHASSATATSYALMQAADGETRLNTADGKRLFLREGNQNRLMIQQGGHVGIGTTDPQEKLQVIGESLIGRAGSQLKVGYMGYDNYGGIAHASSATGTSYALLQAEDGITFLNAADGRNLYLRENNKDRLTMQSGGNVGIGTVHPRLKLEVNGEAILGSTNSQLKIRNMGNGEGYAGIAHASSATGTSYALLQAENGTTFLNAAKGRILYVREDNDDHLVIKNGGNVGIGTLAPTEKLDVAGNIQASGQLGMSSPVMFAAYLSEVAHGEQYTLKLNDVKYNIGGAFNTATYRFEPPVKGIYLFTVTFEDIDSRNNGSTAEWTFWLGQAHTSSWPRLRRHQRWMRGDSYSIEGHASHQSQMEPGRVSRTFFAPLDIGDEVWLSQKNSQSSTSRLSGMEGMLLYAVP